MTDLTLEVPVIDARLCNDPVECRRVAEALADFGCFAFRGTTVDAITPPLTEMLVRYYRQAEAIKDRDVRKDVFYQVGRTPAFVETARPRPDIIATLSPENMPTPFSGADPKERFMAPAGKRAATAEFGSLVMPPVIPEGFPQWAALVDAWGTQAIDMMMIAARMTAIGFGLDPYAIVNLLDGGPHLFAPTGSDLSKYGTPGTALAAFHDDLNAYSIHGKANTAGLRVWLRNGRVIWVKVPDGCMLVQAGQQLEHITGGAVLAGLHEVVANEAMAAFIKAAVDAGLIPWRVSTTLFGHVATDNILEPLGHFATPEALAKYPRMKAGDQVLRELKLLGLA